jgi:hypothetical protein
MAQRAGVSFELERLDVEDDKLVVAGHWSGVRGLRFVRPTLLADNRRILATLEHKPWAPSLDRTWVAAFPWDGADIDVDGLTLDVAPQVRVPLGDAPAADLEPAPEPPPEPEPVPEPEPLPPKVTPLRPAQPPPPPLPAAAAEPEPAGEPAPPSLQSHRLAALEEELYAVARERDAAERDRDRALAQLEEAVAAREAAVRTRTRMQLAHDEALEAREAAAAAVARAQAQRDEANAQRDEVLLAYRALQRHVQTERAQEDRTAAPPPGDEDAEVPIGVRTMPAARTVMAELQRPVKPAGKLPFTAFDLWVIRVLGTVAGGCFILLLVSILRVFV